MGRPSMNCLVSTLHLWKTQNIDSSERTPLLPDLSENKHQVQMLLAKWKETNSTRQQKSLMEVHVPWCWLSLAVALQWMWQGSSKENLSSVTKDRLVYHIGALLTKFVHFPTFEYFVLQLHLAIMYCVVLPLCSHLSATGNNVSSAHTPHLNSF